MLLFLPFWGTPFPDPFLFLVSNFLPGLLPVIQHSLLKSLCINTWLCSLEWMNSSAWLSLATETPTQDYPRCLCVATFWPDPAIQLKTPWYLEIKNSLFVLQSNLLYTGWHLLSINVSHILCIIMSLWWDQWYLRHCFFFGSGLF